MSTVDVLSIAASSPAKGSSGPTLYKPMRELIALPADPTLGAAAPELVAQLVSRIGDETTFVVTCERSQLSAELATPVAILNDRNTARHALSSRLAADDKLSAEHDDKLSAEHRAELLEQRKRESKRCAEYRADIPARVLMAYATQDESAAA